MDAQQLQERISKLEQAKHEVEKQANYQIGTIEGELKALREWLAALDNAPAAESA